MRRRNSDWASYCPCKRSLPEPRKRSAQDSIHIRPTPRATLRWRWVLFRAGRLPDAEQSARQAVLSNPNLADAYLLLAQVHLRQSDLTALVADVDAYLRLDPEGAHNAQARGSSRRGRAVACQAAGQGTCLREDPGSQALIDPASLKLLRVQHSVDVPSARSEVNSVWWVSRT